MGQRPKMEATLSAGGARRAAHGMTSEGPVRLCLPGMELSEE